MNLKNKNLTGYAFSAQGMCREGTAEKRQNYLWFLFYLIKQKLEVKKSN